jgi:hypothetical protein
MGGRAPRREVRANDDSLCRVKFSIPPFDGKYDPDAYLTWELSVDQKFACYEFSDDKKVRAATSEFTDFASVWWHEYQTKNPATIPQTWNALKRIMRNRLFLSIMLVTCCRNYNSLDKVINLLRSTIKNYK